mgnify:CR=1 FL=1
MANIILQPASDDISRTNYEATIEKSVDISLILPHLNQETTTELNQYTREEGLHIWGVKSNHQTAWHKMQRGDLVLFARDNRFFSKAEVIAKIDSVPLANQLWGNYDDNGNTWNLIYFIRKPKPENISYVEFNNIVGYQRRFVPQRFQVLDSIFSLFPNTKSTFSCSNNFIQPKGVHGVK